MPLTTCLIGADNYQEYLECRTQLTKALRQDNASPELDILWIKCGIRTPGWVGCWECHRLGAQLALSQNVRVYLFLESKARPTLRFDWNIVSEAAHMLEGADEQCVINLSILPWPFKGWPRKRVSGHIYANRSAQMNGTTALICSDAYARQIIGTPALLPIDLQMAHMGLSVYVAYPAPFQRNSDPSRTTAPVFGRRVFRSRPGYALLELIDAHPIHCIGVGAYLLALAIVLVAMMIFWLQRRRSRLASAE